MDEGKKAAGRPLRKLLIVPKSETPAGTGGKVM